MVLNFTLKNIRNILIIQTAFAGDVILATPLIRAAATEFPNAKIHFLAIPVTANVLENNPYLTRVWQYDKHNTDAGISGFIKIARKLRGEQFDLALIPHRSFRSALLSFFSGAPIRIGFDTSAGSFLLTHKIKYRKDIHEVERNLSLTEAFAIHSNLLVPEIFPDDNDRAVVENALKASGGNFYGALIAVAPGSVWPTKRWPKELYTQLCQMLSSRKNPVVLVGGPDDQGLCEEIAKAAHSSVTSLAGKLTLRQSAELLRRCRVLITNDSAPLHLASAVSTPTVAIFGPTSPEFGFYPYQTKNRVVEKTLSCRPCSIHGGKKCPIGTHECMLGISPQEVMKAVEEVMNTS